ncbi:aminotransferase class V-fold PLP-dependent enzyme [Mycoplasmopsis columbinasalis]|uniref:Probable cysteine desulfurase n=1 Tax=Mycoplasmopsis columbinasalis TaxID=114880 RepID=A0A449B9J4_9BACT|nr:aminotransferase class V-fold PLP-dependent enzyme [Mycoplasmopsis columbinasalis]VEU77859.1 Probable cysteine desulfurase [Mycoplasmopsis columbinasalis]
MKSNNELKKFFPLLNQIVYFDSSAMMQKPFQVVEAGNDFYTKYAVSTRTSEATIGIKNKETIENLRSKVAKLLNAKSGDKIVFTSGATDSLNKIASMLEILIKKDDQILLSNYNHSSNIGPWILLANKVGAKVIFSENVENDINEKTKIVAFSQVTNTLEKHFDIQKIRTKLQRNQGLIINDAAQAIVSEPVDLQLSDVVVFSANKFYGPTGFGVLAMQKHLAEQLQPTFIGGGTLDAVEKDGEICINQGVMNMEPGTPNLGAIHMFDAAIDFFNEHLGYKKTKATLEEITKYLYNNLANIPNLQLYNSNDNHIVLFNIKGIPAQDVAHYLATKNIYVRAGAFCAQYLKNTRSEKSFVRISLAIYNDKTDCDALIAALKDGGDFLVV